MSVNAVVCIIVSLLISGYLWLCGNTICSCFKLSKLPSMGGGLFINALVMTILGIFIQDGVHYWMVMLIIILLILVASLIYFVSHIRLFDWKRFCIGLIILAVISIILFWNFRIKAYTLGTLSPAIDSVELIMNGYTNNAVILSISEVFSYCSWFDQLMIGILQLVLPIAGFENLVFVLTYTSALLFFFLVIDICFSVCDGLTKYKFVIGMIISISVFFGFYYDLNHYYFSFMSVNWHGLIIGITLIILYQTYHANFMVNIIVLLGLIPVLFGFNPLFQGISLVVLLFGLLLLGSYINDEPYISYGYIIAVWLLFFALTYYFFSQDALPFQAAIVALFAYTLNQVQSSTTRKILVIFTGLSWIAMLLCFYVFKADIPIFGIFEHDMYPGYFNFIESNAWMGLVLMALCAFFYIRAKDKDSSFACWILIAGNPLILYLTSIHEVDMTKWLPVLACNSFLLYFVLIQSREWLNHLNSKKLNVITISIASLMLFLSTDSMADVNQVYVSKEIKSFDYYNRLESDIKDIIGHTNAYIESKGWNGQTINIISQMEFIRAYVPNILLLYDYDMVYNHCQYCDVEAMNMHQPDPLTNIFAIREYADNRLFIEQLEYENGCELVKSNDYRLFIFDKEQFYNDGTNYYPISNVLNGCTNLIYENERYGLYAIK